MNFVKGIRKTGYSEIDDIIRGNCSDEKVSVVGSIYNIRDMSDFAFVIIRKRDGLIQCVYNKETSGFDINDIPEESCVVAEGTISRDERAPNGFELHLTGIKVLSKPVEKMPVATNKRKMGLNLDTNLNLRPITLRNNTERSIFKIQEGIVRGFRDFLHGEGFTEIRSPKIVSSGAEGGANIFTLDYFGRKAFLAQSPQFYKQTMVGVFERVFEIGPVYRAEKHNTSRHLNEYTSMDFEMGFIESFEDIMTMEAAMLRYTFNLLKTEYSKYFIIQGVEIPEIPENIPQVRFADAKRMASEKYNKKIKNPYDLEPEEEVLIGKLFKEEYNSDFVFVTHYPTKKRPFYAMEDPEDPTYTLSFDLLYGGMEITTGGQRIHDYQMQVDKMISKGMHIEEFDSYLMIHKHGMPPHGGLGIGLERIVMKLLGQNNVRQATLFPRDLTRLEP